MTHFETLLQDDKKGQVRDRVYIRVGRQVSRRVPFQVLEHVGEPLWIQIATLVYEELYDTL